MTYYDKTIPECIKDLKSSKDGLTSEEAQKRIEKYGENVLQTEIKVSAFKIFISQFQDFIVYILLFAVFFSILAGEYVDAAIIGVILFANAVIGFWQEFSAQKSLAALQEMTSLKANVLRDGNFVRVDSAELVPGDIIALEAGDRIPADARILESNLLKVEESSLTGESVPVSKNDTKINRKVQISEQKNMLFSSTTLAAGTAKAIVCATGMKTEIGKITDLIREVKEEVTPLQRRLDNFGKILGKVIIFICIVVFALSFGKEYIVHGFSKTAMLEFFLIAISLAVAAVPTALPAVVTIALSIGVKKLLKNNALVRRLSSVETLGSCDVICTDKTGTLTKNEMTVRSAWTMEGEVEFDGLGYSPEGSVIGKPVDLLFKIGHACNNASLYLSNDKWNITGDPTEGALLVSARKANADFSFKKVKELPFDSNRKLMSVLAKVQKQKDFQVYVKGAPDQLVKKCSHILIKNKRVKITKKHLKEIAKQNDHYSKKALRVLAFAHKTTTSSSKLTEEKLTFVGLQAMIDPPRDDVIESIRKTKEAGIRTIMITGDHKGTAVAIANEIGIHGNALTGEDLDNIDDRKLTSLLKKDTNIFARVIPEHKQRIVGILQKLNHTVAMTGDGVNDAPALKQANIGVAVGSGTEVAKEASDLVLLDDSFTSIVTAVEQGRGIYDNIQKSIMLLLSGNLGEVLIIFLAILFGFNLPLTAVLLLWINLITDGAPALAYSLDPYGRHIMRKPPRPFSEPLLPAKKIILLLTLGIVGTAIALVLFVKNGGNVEGNGQLQVAQTVVFNFVVLYELILAYAIRNNYDVPIFSNAWLWLAIVFSVVMQGVIMYTPMSGLFDVVPLPGHKLTQLMIGGIIFYFAALIFPYILHPLYDRVMRKRSV